jgi:hypothetical protein
MTDQVIAWAEETCDENSVPLEVDPVDRRIRRKSRAVEDLQVELLFERKLSAPGRASPDDASVDEHEPFHGKILPL